MDQKSIPGTIQEEDKSDAQKRARWRWLFRYLPGSALLLCAGLAIAWIDTRPEWDDTGITAGLILLASGLGSLAGIQPWLTAAIVVGPILVAELSGGTGVLLAIPIALAGAFSGAFIRRQVLK
jgi:hypothetical protein